MITNKKIDTSSLSTIQIELASVSVNFSIEFFNQVLSYCQYQSVILIGTIGIYKKSWQRESFFSTDKSNFCQREIMKAEYRTCQTWSRDGWLKRIWLLFPAAIRVGYDQSPPNLGCSSNMTNLSFPLWNHVTLRIAEQMVHSATPTGASVAIFWKLVRLLQ